MTSTTIVRHPDGSVGRTRCAIWRDTAIAERQTIQGSDLAKRLEALIHEGNVRHIVVKHGGHTIAEFPVTIGVVGAVLAAPVVAVGALAALLTDCTIEIEPADEEGKSEE